MKKKLKKIPKFNNEDEEREFWHTHDSTEYVDYSDKSKRVYLSLEKSIEKPFQDVKVRLPKSIMIKLKVMATKRDVSYDSLIKMILAEKLRVGI